MEFRAATAVSVADHKAVLLKMKNERRASLLIVDALLTRESGFKSIGEKSGSASLWSDGRQDLCSFVRRQCPGDACVHGPDGHQHLNLDKNNILVMRNNLRLYRHSYDRSRGREDPGCSTLCHEKRKVYEPSSVALLVRLFLFAQINPECGLGPGQSRSSNSER